MHKYMILSFKLGNVIHREIDWVSCKEKPLGRYIGSVARATIYIISLDKQYMVYTLAQFSCYNIHLSLTTCLFNDPTISAIFHAFRHKALSEYV